MPSLFPMGIFRKDARQELYTSAKLKITARQRSLNVVTAFVTAEKLRPAVTMTANICM